MYRRLALGLYLLGTIGLSQGCATSADGECASLDGCVTDPGDEVDGKADGLSIRRDWRTGFVVIGETAAVDDVIADLEQLTATATGRALVDRVDARATELAGRVVLRARPDPAGDYMTCANTVFANGGAELRRAQIVAYHMDERERVVPDEAGASLTPGNVRVLYNRECQARYDDGLACAPGYVYLGHELVHVFHALHGHIANHIGDPSDPMPGGSNHEEAWTIGRGAYAGTELTENALRLELELPLRVTHGSLCGPR
jgi:hypothetical protein